MLFNNIEKTSVAFNRITKLIERRGKTWIIYKTKNCLRLRIIEFSLFLFVDLVVIINSRLKICLKKTYHHILAPFFVNVWALYCR